jgi:hypothetical protein
MDLNTVFVGYLQWLREESLQVDLDTTTLVALDRPNVLDGEDANTAYALWTEPVI